MNNIGIVSNALVIIGLLLIGIRVWVILRSINHGRPWIFDLLVLAGSLASALVVIMLAYYFEPSVPALPFFAGLLLVSLALLSYVYPLRRLFRSE